jgi:hypothetical protein
MNQHNEHHADQQGDVRARAVSAAGEAPVDEPDPGLAEHEKLAEQPDLSEHEAAVPSSAADGPPDVGEDEAVAAPSNDGGPVDVSEDATRAALSTGDDRVDEALSRLDELDRLDVTEHAGVVEDVHRALQDTLAEEED